MRPVNFVCRWLRRMNVLSFIVPVAILLLLPKDQHFSSSFSSSDSPSFASAAVRVSEDWENLYFVSTDQSTSDVQKLFARRRLQAAAADDDDDDNNNGDDGADGNDDKMPIVLFFIAKLQGKYHQAATEYPVLHLAERVARELQHEQDISIVVVPEENERFLSLLNYRYDLFTGIATDHLPTPKCVHISTLSVPTLLMFDFRRLKAFEFRGFNVDQSLFEKLTKIVRFVGKALSGDWPPFQTLQQSFSDPDYIRHQYHRLSPPFKYFDGAHQLCGAGNVRTKRTLDCNHALLVTAETVKCVVLNR